jgi:hypothetical protein
MMANEFTINSGIKLNNSPLLYSSLPTSFQASQVNRNGPTPGAVTIPTTAGGTAINLSSLATPGICRCLNMDPTNFVSLGVNIAGTFYPFAELLPGENYVFRLSRTVASTLRALADTASVGLLFECFDK